MPQLSMRLLLAGITVAWLVHLTVLAMTEIDARVLGADAANLHLLGCQAHALRPQPEVPLPRNPS